MPKLDNVHPGDILREDYLEALGKTAYWLAKQIGMTPTAVGEILKAKRSVTAATALRLAKLLGTSPEFWTNLQAAYDLEEAKAASAAELEQIEPYITADDGLVEELRPVTKNYTLPDSNWRFPAVGLDRPKGLLRVPAEVASSDKSESEEDCRGREFAAAA